LRIVDSRGALVGYFVDGWGDTAVVPIGDQWYRFQVNTDGFVGTPHSSYFETVDCTGPAYASPNPEPGKFFKTILGVEAGKAYLPGTVLADRTVRSGVDPSTGQCLSFGQDSWTAPMVNIDVFSLAALVPPFKVAQ
jgi:hypothetical protein